MKPTLACLQRGLCALSLRYLFRGGDVDANNFAAWAVLRVPIGHPESFLSLVCALPCNLDARYRVAGIHDRADDAFDRLRRLSQRTISPADTNVVCGAELTLGKAKKESF
jgi:hypothetical protein